MTRMRTGLRMGRTFGIMNRKGQREAGGLVARLRVEDNRF